MLTTPRLGEWLAGALGAVLLVSLFLPWYGGECPTDAVRCDSVTGWEAFSLLDFLLALTALMGIGLLIAATFAKAVAVPTALSALTALIGTIALVATLIRLLVSPDGADEVRFAVLGAIGVLGVASGAWLSMRDEGFGLRPAPGIEATKPWLASLPDARPVPSTPAEPPPSA